MGDGRTKSENGGDKKFRGKSSYLPLQNVMAGRDRSLLPPKMLPSSNQKILEHILTYSVLRSSRACLRIGRIVFHQMDAQVTMVQKLFCLKNSVIQQKKFKQFQLLV